MLARDNEVLSTFESCSSSFPMKSVASQTPLIHSQLPGKTPIRGKVRDVYDFGDSLLFVATDRIRAIDWVLPNVIPDKRRDLTQLSRFWFEFLKPPDHLLSMNPSDLLLPPGTA